MSERDTLSGNVSRNAPVAAISEELTQQADKRVFTNDLDICGGDCACPGCGGDGHNNWFDRSICPKPCDSMHTRCAKCGTALDQCLFEEADLDAR